MTNFWQRLPKPFTVLAPMEDVTDVVFREIVAGLPRPDVFFTEFTSADGLASSGREKTILKLKYTSRERPIVAQIWGIHPGNMKLAAQTVEKLKFDGVDINMGCPDKAVVKKGAGVAMCTNPKLAKEIIAAVRAGAPNLPLSVKTRLGFDKVITEKWIGFLLKQNLDALTVHGRTGKQKSEAPANWNQIGKAVGLRDELAPNTVLIGNGDVKDWFDAQKKHKEHQVDGIMIGRGIFGNPWAFQKVAGQHTRKEYFEILKKHLVLFKDTWGETRNFAVMKKFFKMYVNNFQGAAKARANLMESKNYEEAIERVNVLSLE